MFMFPCPIVCLLTVNEFDPFAVKIMTDTNNSIEITQEEDSGDGDDVVIIVKVYLCRGVI